MNKSLFYLLYGLFFVFLLIFGFTTSILSFISLFLLFTIGLTICILKINEVTKSKNSLKSKIYFSFIFSFLIFSLLIFFWALGPNPLKDEFGFGSIIISIVSLTGFIISLITGIILSIKRKDNSTNNYNIKPIIILSSIFVVIALLLYFYNPLVSGLSQASKNENLCYLTLSISDNSDMFNKGYKTSCFVKLATLKLDTSICKKSGDTGSYTGCYIKVATASKDTDVCKKGVEEGLNGMQTCFSLVAEETDKTQETMINLVKICESKGECDHLADFDSIIFDVLKNPQSPNLIYAINATKYLWREGQRESAIPLLRNLLTTAPLIERRTSIDSLLYITSLMNLEAEKVELRQILPLIENQSDLSDYTEKVKQRLSAQALTPTSTTTTTTPQ